MERLMLRSWHSSLMISSGLWALIEPFHSKKPMMLSELLIRIMMGRPVRWSSLMLLRLYWLGISTGKEAMEIKDIIKEEDGDNKIIIVAGAISHNSNPITADGVTNLSKITADGDSSHNNNQIIVDGAINQCNNKITIADGEISHRTLHNKIIAIGDSLNSNSNLITLTAAGATPNSKTITVAGATREAGERYLILIYKKMHFHI